MTPSFLTEWAARPRWMRLLSILVALVVTGLVRLLGTHDAHTSIAANTFLFADWLTMKGLQLLTNKLSVANYFNTSYGPEYTKEFAVGETIRIKLPNRGVIRDGLGYSPQPIQRINTTVAVNQIFGYDFEWDSAERALKMERGEAAIEREYLEPAMAQIAQEIDSRCALFAYQNSNNIVGQLGTDPVDFDTTSAAARQRLVELGCPPSGNRGMIVQPAVMRALKKSAIGYFNPVTDIAKQFRTGIVGAGDGFEWYESMSLYSHTAGTWAGAVTVNGAGQSGSTLNVTCTTGDTFNVGDAFNVAATNQVNPMTRRKTTAVLKQFVVTAPAVGAASAATLSISPAIFGPGSPYQNVDALPANAAALTLFPGTTSPSGKSGVNGLALHEDAYALVGVKLETPKAAEIASQTRDPESGISVRFVRMFDPQSSKMINRFDVLMGFGALYPDNCAVRILGA